MKQPKHFHVFRAMDTTVYIERGSETLMIGLVNEEFADRLAALMDDVVDLVQADCVTKSKDPAMARTQVYCGVVEALGKQLGAFPEPIWVGVDFGREEGDCLVGEGDGI